MSFTVFYKKGRGEEIVQEGATREEAEQLIARLFRDEFRFVKARCENSGVLIDHSFVLPDMDELTSDCSLCLRFHGKDVDDMQWFDLDSYLSTEIEDAWVELCEDKDMDDDNPQYIIVGVGSNLDAIASDLLGEDSAEFGPAELDELGECLDYFDGRQLVDAFVTYLSEQGVSDPVDSKSDFEDHYYGEWDSDEDFAMDYAESLCLLDDSKWPYTHIDWESASRDLMFDFAVLESPGGCRYYFRY